MKFIICFALFLAAAQAHVVSPVVSTYAAGIPLSYSTPLVRSSAYVRAAPLAYSSYSGLPVTTYSAGYAPTVYGAPSVYGAPAVYSSPAVYSTLLRK